MRAIRTSLGRALSGASLLAFLAGSLASPAPASATTVYAFTGGGWGHGIGLSQWGARGYALQGRPYDWIIRHYFQGTSLRQMSTVTVKVDLDVNAAARTSWQISSGSDSASLTVTDYTSRNVRVVLRPATPYWITVSAGNVRVQADRVGSGGIHVPGAVLKTFTGAAFASSGPPSLVRMRSASGPFGQTDINWRGTIVFWPDGATKSHARNYVPIESYLYGVVPRESPSSWPAEALKAQAVAARSYAYQDAVDGRVMYCSTRSQVYNGHSRPDTNHEAGSTNSAVNATRGMVVFHPSSGKPIKTFFSSCSGGHTANIEDVWTSSEPRPYYVGVDDADQDATYYRWGPYTFTDTEVSSKIRSLDARDGDYDYSVAAPAVVRSILLAKASSGHVRYASIAWSNGATYRVTGYTVQSALGLRSTRFSASASAQPFVTFQDTDRRIAWNGDWETTAAAGLSGGSQHVAGEAGAMAVATFEGTAVRWFGSRGPAYGKANVYLDGRWMRTLDLYAPTETHRHILLTLQGFGFGKHVLAIRALGSRSPASSGTRVSVDAVQVAGGALEQTDLPETRYEQEDSRILTSGEWVAGSSPVLSGDSQLYTDESGAKAYVRFSGTGITWLSNRSPSYGRARVTLDGGASELVDLRADTVSYQQAVWSRTGLAHRPHTLVIEAVGPESEAESAYIALDAFDVEWGELLRADYPILRYEESATGLEWSGMWTHGSSGVLSGGAQRYTAEPGASLSVPFRGTGFGWIGNRSPSYGLANVYLDGRYLTTIDLFAPSPRYRQTLFSRSGLPSDAYTLKIRAVGRRSAASRGYTVAVDAIDVLGELGR